MCGNLDLTTRRTAGCRSDPYFEAIVDASPLRAGKLLPGTHTPIVFRDAMRP
jgi:hypothetical protein